MNRKIKQSFEYFCSNLGVFKAVRDFGVYKSLRIAMELKPTSKLGSYHK
jgi:hypothetical protein